MQFNIQENTEREQLKQHLNLLYINGKEQVEVKEIKSKRSLNANALYWKWLSIISAEIGDNVDSLHYAFKSKFLGWEIVETKFSKSKRPKSSSKLSISEFYQFMLQVELFTKEFLNISLPQPTKSILKAIEKDALQHKQK